MLEIKTSNAPVDYLEALRFMEERVRLIHEKKANECLYFLEHPPIYTLGTGTKPGDHLTHGHIPSLETSRGGRSTYHGPGQRVVYVMLDLNKRGRDLHALVRALENWVIATLSVLGVQGVRRNGMAGVWVEDSKTQTHAKIAALGLRVRKWVSFHGLSINVDPDMDHYAGIVPCGLSGERVTSLKELGVDVNYTELDQIMQDHLEMELLACLS